MDDSGSEDENTPGVEEQANPGDLFMLAEFQNMRYFHQEETAINERRVDILLAVASGAAAAVVLLAQIGVERQFLLGLAALGCLGLLVIGIPVFMDTLHRDITAVDYIRSINRIRAYFVQRDPTINRFLLMPTNAYHPPYGDLSSSRRASAAINSAVAGVLFAALRMLWYGERDPDLRTAYTAAGIMVIIFIGHLLIWRWVYAKASRQTRDLPTIALVESAETQLKKERATQKAAERDARRAQKRQDGQSAKN